MTRYIAVVFAALIGLVGFVGASSEADARCGGCGPVAPVYHYNTVNKVMNRTQYRDVRRTHYVHKVRRIYNITRVRPVIRVHIVTRVHHYNVPVIRNVVVNSMQVLPARYVSSHSVQNIYHGCGCR